MDDEEIREWLLAIDDSEEVDVTNWEANFIDSVCYQYDGPLTEKQRNAAKTIIERYKSKV